MSALQDKTLAQQPVLFLALELSNRTWRLVFGDALGRRRHHAIEAGDWAVFTVRLKEAKAKFHLPDSCRVVSLYEAGRDGFWIHRKLLDLGIDNRIIDSSSIEVDRKARRAKTDRIDGEKLLALLQQAHRGERRLRAVAVPSIEEEDRRHLHRERERLLKERRALTNRTYGILALDGIKPKSVLGRDWEKRLGAWQRELSANRYQELLRLTERLALIKQQIEAIDTERNRLLEQDTSEAVCKVHQLLQLRGLGEQSAWLFVMECFGWRRFKNRRELAASVGIVGTPYASGESHHEQGISKSGNRRMRYMLIEIAWCWLRYQPDSALAQWYKQRFAGGGRRMQRIGIVALARRLLIALWRYLEQGEMPTGAVCKPASA